MPSRVGTYVVNRIVDRLGHLETLSDEMDGCKLHGTVSLFRGPVFMSAVHVALCVGLC